MKLPFQTILIGVSIAAFIGAILIFAGVIKVGSSSQSSSSAATVSVWGVYPSTVVQPYIDSLNIENKSTRIYYEEVSGDALAGRLTAALAEGQQPDLLITDSENFFSIRNRVYTIPFTTYPERSFRDTYVDGSALFLSQDGVMALPLLVDPVVAYYNKDMLAGKNYVVPPTTWTSLVSLMPQFVKNNAKGAITQTLLPFGEYSNVDHFKDILATLFLQVGNPITTFDTVTQSYTSTLATTGASEENPVISALAFFVNFSNPTSDTYSWNKTLSSGLDMFLSGKSAFYIGRASELFTLQKRNPNLNFDVTQVFQPVGIVRPTTFGSFSSLSIVKATTQFDAAYTVAGQLSGKEFVEYLAGETALPPARRDILVTPQKNPYVQVFFKSALNAFGWPDINPAATENVFRDMIQGVTSGRYTPAEAIYETSRNLQSVIR